MTSADPRVTRTREAVLAAAREVLISDGWERVTVAVVAERSGFARTTLYRHWPHRLDLLRDLMGREALLRHAERTGDLRNDLVAQLEAFREAISDDSLGPMVVAVGQLARQDPEFGRLQDDLRLAGSAVMSEIVVDAIERGELPASSVPDVVIARLVGPVLYAYLLGPAGQMTDDFVEGVVDAALAGLERG
jgi:AcrR family transcriptional regulator